MTCVKSSDTQGIFITFEGGEGAGKTTHIHFLADVLRARGYEVVCLREPGGTQIGEQLRNVVLDPRNDAMTAETELLIYEAARAQVVAQTIKPALARGAVVVCDRFIDSTVAYQVYGRGLAREFVDAANEFACRGIYPHRTVLMSADGTATTGLVRATRRGADRLERAGKDFHARVNEAFFDIARANSKRVRVVFSAGSKSDTAARVFSQLEDLFPWMAEIISHDTELFKRLDTGHSKEKYPDLSTTHKRNADS